MTDRIPLDDMTSDQLDQLHNDLDRYEEVVDELNTANTRLARDLGRAEADLARYAEAESADAAAGSYAGRAERVEAQLDQVQKLLDTGSIGCCAHLVRAALIHNDYAIAQPQPWLHVALASPDETSANTSALAIRDHLAAEFDGVSMRITTNATEAEPDPFSYEERERTGRNAGLTCPAATEATEQEKTTTRVFAALHRSAEQDVTRVINLYERWVKAGPPPLGVSMARWWDARLVELHDAIRPPADEPARTTTKDQP